MHRIWEGKQNFPHGYKELIYEFYQNIAKIVIKPSTCLYDRTKQKSKKLLALSPGLTSEKYPQPPILTLMKPFTVEVGVGGRIKYVR